MTSVFYPMTNEITNRKYVVSVDYVTKFNTSLYYPTVLKSYMPLTKDRLCENLWYEDFTKLSNDIVSYNTKIHEYFYGTKKYIDAFVPIGYLNLLGALFQDNKNYRIFARYYTELLSTKPEIPPELSSLDIEYYYIPVDNLEDFVKAIN